MNEKTLIVALLGLVTAGLCLAQTADYENRTVRDPVQLKDHLNTDMTAVSARLAQVEALGITNTTSAVTVGSLTTTGTVSATIGTISGTLGVTGVATFTAIPKFVVTNAPGAVVASALNNLPTSASTNALFLRVTVGTVNYAVPMYAVP